MLLETSVLKTSVTAPPPLKTQLPVPPVKQSEAQLSDRRVPNMSASRTNAGSGSAQLV